MRALSHWTGCSWFWGWALVGAAFTIGAVSLGVLVLVPGTVAVVLMTRRRPIRGAFGLFTGVGAVLLVVAYLQRPGPGESCARAVTGVVCDLHLDPLPWLVAGVLCVAAGLVGHARQDA